MGGAGELMVVEKYYYSMINWNELGFIRQTGVSDMNGK